jgi:glycosidase
MDCIYHSTEPDNVLRLQHPDFYVHDRAGRVVLNQFGFAELNFHNRAVVAYMVAVTKFWASVGFDGCRADLANAIPMPFWAMINNELKRANPNWLMIGEVQQDLAEYAGSYSGPGFRSGEKYRSVYAFDAIYGATYMAVLRSIINGRAAPQTLEQVWTHSDLRRTGLPAGTELYTGVDNHDQTPRAAALRGGNDGMMAAMTVSFTIGGIPFIFNGQEIGDTTPTSFYSQRFIDWTHPRDPENAAVFSKLTALRRANPELIDGTTTFCNTIGTDGPIAYVRARGSDRALVVVNLSAKAWQGYVTLPARIAARGSFVDLNSGRPLAGDSHSVHLSLRPDTFVIALSRA